MYCRLACMLAIPYLCLWHVLLSCMGGDSRLKCYDQDVMLSLTLELLLATKVAKRDSMWLARMPLCQYFLYLQGCLVVDSKYNQSRYELLSAVPSCNCRNMQSSGVFEYCCMKISHIIIVHQGTCEIIHIHYSCYFFNYFCILIH